MLEDSIVIIGGQLRLEKVTSEVIVIYNKGSVNIYDYNYSSVYYSSFAHYKDRIYSLGNYPIPSTRS